LEWPGLLKMNEMELLNKTDYFDKMERVLSQFPLVSSKHLYARKLRAAARLKKRRGIVLNMPKKPR
jgi:hypothetical protein